jgi:hypothetical protein
MKPSVDIVKGFSSLVTKAAIGYGILKTAESIGMMKLVDSACEYIGIPFGASEALTTIGSIVSVAGLVSAMVATPATIVKSFDREKNYGLLINMQECRSHRKRQECLDALRAFNKIRADAGKELFGLALKALSFGGNVTGALGESLLGSAMKKYNENEKSKKAVNLDYFVTLSINKALDKAVDAGVLASVLGKPDAVRYLRYLGYDQLALKMIGWTENDQTFNKDINKRIIQDDEWFQEIMPLTCAFINDPIEHKHAFDEKYCMSDDDTAAALKAIADKKTVVQNAQIADAWADANLATQFAHWKATDKIEIGESVHFTVPKGSTTVIMTGPVRGIKESEYRVDLQDGHVWKKHSQLKATDPDEIIKLGEKVHFTDQNGSIFGGIVADIRESLYHVVLQNGDVWKKHSELTPHKLCVVFNKVAPLGFKTRMGLCTNLSR